MIRANSRVRRKDTASPIGLVTFTFGPEFGPTLVTVRWGIQDGREFIEDIDPDDLEEVEYKGDKIVHKNVFDIYS